MSPNRFLLRIVLPKREGVAEIVGCVIQRRCGKSLGRRFFSSSRAVLRKWCGFADVALCFNHNKPYKVQNATEPRPNWNKVSGKKGALSEVNNRVFCYYLVWSFYTKIFFISFGKVIFFFNLWSKIKKKSCWTPRFLLSNTSNLYFYVAKPE